MADSVAAIVLAAGAGARLSPLSRFRPKPLCPVGGVPLLDGNLERVEAVVGRGPATVAVNAHHHAAALAAHVAGRAHLSVEEPEALGTAGGVAHLRPWLDGRAALVVNGDTWSSIDLRPLVEGWSGDVVRVLVVGSDGLVPGVGVLGSLLPPAVIAGLPHRPAGLYEACWKPLQAEGRIEVVGADDAHAAGREEVGPQVVRREVVGADGAFVACDRPADYLRANLLASGGVSVVGEGAVVEGEVVRSVVWPGQRVEAGERLVDAVRYAPGRTLLIR
jgi:N-acetyl-alpha-D-muramate 1-phosphate uridylyltransferase